MLDTLAYLDDSKMVNSSEDLLTMSEDERDQLVSPLQRFTGMDINQFAPSGNDFMWNNSQQPNPNI